MADHEKSRTSSHDEDPELVKEHSKITEGAADTAQEHAAPVKWTFTRVVAVVSLCLVYVGQ